MAWREADDVCVWWGGIRPFEAGRLRERQAGRQTGRQAGRQAGWQDGRSAWGVQAHAPMF